jgi:hypothetical protein
MQLRRRTLTHDAAQWWAALAGLIASVIVLVLLVGAVLHVTLGPHAFREPPFHWSSSVMHALFGKLR